MDDGEEVPAEWFRWDCAGRAASALLLSALEPGQRCGPADRWFIREEPHRRLRCTGSRPARVLLDVVPGRPREQDAVTPWTHGVHEPEVRAFGGSASTEPAHVLFHTAGRHLLAYPARKNSGRGGTGLPRTRSADVRRFPARSSS
ncbi:lantibiotic dehydratase C-terminal domain-containing protein [Actinorugispora endophytica]|uniref:lantibiotic dehydratase C-terminal domain-containing protein n=1 Tax=Actinorugispora endophytica TaxID=1605990 RepID=UPI0037434B63